MTLSSLPRQELTPTLDLLRAVLDRTNDAVEVFDPSSGQLVYVNRKACADLGYGDDELLALTVFDVDADAHVDRAAFAAIIDELRTSGTLVRNTARRRQDGSTFPVEVTLSWVEVDRPFAVAVVRDLTERRRAEDSLKRSARAHADFVNSIDGIVWEADPQTFQFTFVSDQAERLLGYPTSQWIIQPGFWVAHVHPDDREYAVNYCKTRTERGESHEFEYRMVAADGRDVWLQDIVTVIVEGGRPVAMRGVMVDITRRRETEEALRASEEQLLQAQKMEAVGQLSGGIAHDFNNLLTVIQGNATMLEAEAGLAPPLVEAVRAISASSERAASLTRKLLTVSRRQPMQQRPLDVNELVRHMSSMLERIVGEDIVVRVALAGEPLIVAGDAGMLDQVLLNLAVNARDAMPRGGHFTIETSARTLDSPAAPGRAASSRTLVCIRVIDTGCGIPADQVPRVFEPFFTTKDVGRGTGLGLSTAYGIVQQHQGSIDVASEVGRGSTFTILLPRLPGDRQTPAPLRDVSVATGGSETILVVEDEAPLLTLVRNVLTRAGYRVLTAPTGPAALDVWKAHGENIGLLLTDLVMPDGMSGLELAKRLRQDKADLKVLYMSGYSADIVGDDYLLEEGVNFLTKPYRPPQLLRALRALLDQQPEGAS